MPRKPYRSDLTDAQWDYLKRRLPRSARTGRPRAAEREVGNGILYVLHTGGRWEDMPPAIRASPKTCNRRLLEYQRRGVWQRLVAALLKEADRRGLLNFKNCSHDASVVQSKKGQTKRSATQASTALKGGNATWSLPRMAIRSISL
jgi:transposase